MKLQNGTILKGGTYKIVRHISSGGFGNTYEALDVNLDKRVAIKEFFVKDFCSRESDTTLVTIASTAKKPLIEHLKKKFIEEARAIAKMEHDNIVKVQALFEENGTAYYVMDYIDGESLSALLKRRGSLPEKEAVAIILKVANALGYMHKQNRFHLDVKPANIMLRKDGKVILIDFGSSKQYAEVDGENSTTLAPCYTTGYAPSEQMNPKFTAFTAATDVYALGATLYKMLTGHTPPSSIDLQNEEEKLSPLPQEISQNVRECVEKAMIPQRNIRMQSVEEFKKLTKENLISEPSIEEATQVEGQTVAQTSKKAKSLYPIKKWIFALFGIVYVLTMTFLFYYVYYSSKISDLYYYRYGNYQYKEGIPVRMEREWSDELQEYVDKAVELNIADCERFHVMSIALGIVLVLVTILLLYNCVRSNLSIINRKVKVASWWVTLLLTGGLFVGGISVLLLNIDLGPLFPLVVMADTLIALLVLLYLRSRSNVEERWDCLMPDWFAPNASRGTRLWYHLLLIWPVIFILPAPFGWGPCIPIAIGLVIFLPISFICYVIRIARGKE